MTITASALSRDLEEAIEFHNMIIAEGSKALVAGLDDRGPIGASPRFGLARRRWTGMLVAVVAPTRVVV